MSINNKIEDRLVVLAFEGPDKAGKTTLIRELNKATEYRYLCIDRFIGSTWVYDLLTGRRDRTEGVLRAEAELRSLETILIINILVHCDPDILRRRIAAEDEFSVQRLAELEKALELYKYYREVLTQLPKIEVDTSSQSIEEAVQQIIAQIHQYENSHNK